MHISENLLHFVWQFRLYQVDKLRTTDGQEVTVLDPGQYNHNAGPDFEFARVRIDGTMWSGHVEIHVDAKDWQHHKHHLDPTYNSTVLHVVWNANFVAQRSDGTPIMTVPLTNCIKPDMLSNYGQLMHNLNWIPCEKQIAQVQPHIQQTWLERMAVERMESRHQYLGILLDKTKNHWEKVLLLSLGRAFGMKVNAIAFEQLLHRVEFPLLLKYQHEQPQLEALLFGVSGLLPSEVTDDYTKALQKEFAYLHKVHKLSPLSPTEWKFHRMRPYNFPTFRLAQLTALYHQEVYWFDTILQTDQLYDIRQKLKAVSVDRYWSQHFRFGQPTALHSTELSDTFIDHIVINCFAPILFAFGKFVDSEIYKSKAIEWMEQTKKEKNAITKRFESLGLLHDNAATSQGLLHLKSNYCDQKKCLSCAIGLAILKG